MPCVRRAGSLAVHNLPTIIKLAAIVLNKLMRQKRARGRGSRASRRVRPDDDTRDDARDNREIGGGSVSNPNFTPLDRANVRDFSPGYLSRRVHRRRRRERGTPEVWFLPTDKELRLLA